MEFPDPWPGGWWRLRDIVDYELTLSLSLLRTAALYREEFLLNSYRMNKSAVETVDKGQPYAFVIPAIQHDYPTMLKMLDVLKLRRDRDPSGGQADFTADGKALPGRIVRRPLAQPYKPYAWALLERQKYPDLRAVPRRPARPALRQRRLDAAACRWGSPATRSTEPFAAELEKIDKVPFPGPSGRAGERGPISSLSSRLNASYAVAFALLEERRPRSTDNDRRQGHGIEPPGRELHRQERPPRCKKALPALLEKLHVDGLALDDAAGIPAAPSRTRASGSTSPGGRTWTRAGRATSSTTWASPTPRSATPISRPQAGTPRPEPAKVDLKAKYDVIVFAGENARYHQDRQDRSRLAVGPLVHPPAARIRGRHRRRRASRP